MTKTQKQPWYKVTLFQSTQLTVSMDSSSCGTENYLQQAEQAYWC